MLVRGGIARVSTGTNICARYKVALQLREELESFMRGAAVIVVACIVGFCTTVSLIRASIFSFENAFLASTRLGTFSKAEDDLVDT